MTDKKIKRDPERPFAHTLLATDLDGTFLGKGSQLIERNLEAVEKFKSGGGYFTAATGRIQQDMLTLIPEAATLFNAPAIMANGAYLHDFSTGQSFCESTVPTEAMLEFLHFVHEADEEVGVRVCTSDGFFANADWPNPFVTRDMTSTHRHDTAHTLPLADWPLDELKVYKLVVRGTQEMLARVRPVVEAHFGDRFAYTSSAPVFYELQTGGCDKGTGLRALASWIAQKEGRAPYTVAAGNHENDLPMLTAADEAGCPDDALESIKPFCKYILCPHTDGCIADLIRQLEEDGD